MKFGPTPSTTVAAKRTLLTELNNSVEGTYHNSCCSAKRNGGTWNRTLGLSVMSQVCQPLPLNHGPCCAQLDFDVTIISYLKKDPYHSMLINRGHL